MKKLMLIAALALVASPAMAKPHHASPAHHRAQVQLHHFVKGVKHRLDAPLPLAAGLPALALMGGALAFARRRKG